MRVRAGLQKWHWPEDILQFTFSVQAPHWQAICCPTRFTSSLSIWDSVWATAIPTSARKRKLRFHLRMGFLRYSYDFGTRIRARHLARHEGHKGSEDRDQRSDPDPVDEREHVSLQGGLIAGARGVVDVEIFVEPAAQGDDGGGLLGGFIDAATG